MRKRDPPLQNAKEGHQNLAASPPTLRAGFRGLKGETPFLMVLATNSFLRQYFGALRGHLGRRSGVVMSFWTPQALLNHVVDCMQQRAHAEQHASLTYGFRKTMLVSVEGRRDQLHLWRRVGYPCICLGPYGVRGCAAGASCERSQMNELA